MPKVIYTLSIVAFGALFLLTLILTYLNFGPELRTRIYTSVAIGLVTILSTVLFNLKETVISTAFSVDIAFDDKENRPLKIPMGEARYGDLAQFYSNLSMIADLGQFWWNLPKEHAPKTDDERIKFVGDLLQYKILQDVKNWIVPARIRPIDNPLPAQMRSTVEDSKHSSDAINIEGDIVRAALAENPVIRQPQLSLIWDDEMLRLPAGTKVKASYLSNSPQNGAPAHLLSLKKPLYFDVEFIVQPLLNAPKEGTPSQLNLTAQEAINARTFSFKVIMKATFHALTSGSKERGEYVTWVKWLFGKIVKQWSLDESPLNDVN